LSAIPKALVDRTVLGIDRQHANASLLRLFEDQTATTDDAFLIGDGDIIACLNGCKRRFKARSTNNGGEDATCGPRRSFDHSLLPTCGFNSASFQTRPKVWQLALVGDDSHLWPEFERLSGQLFCATASSQSDDVKPVIVILVGLTDHIECIAADGAGRPHNRN
jgi:hypothetical protein